MNEMDEPQAKATTGDNAVDGGDAPLALRVLTLAAPVLGFFCAVAIDFQIECSFEQCGDWFLVVIPALAFLAPLLMGVLMACALRRQMGSWTATLFGPWILTTLMMFGTFPVLGRHALFVFLTAPLLLSFASLGGLSTRLVLGWVRG